MKRKTTYSFTIEHQGEHSGSTPPPRRPSGTTWLIVRIAGLVVGLAHVIPSLIPH